MDRTETLPATDAGVARAADLIREGRLVAFPTETVYGLGGDATDDRAVARIFEAKGRPRFNPLIVHLPDLAAATRIAVFDDRARNVALAFWPGPLTLVLPLAPGAGLSAERLALRAAERPFNFSDVVHPMPVGFTRIGEGDRLHLAGRDWLVRLGQGHAPDHATLWSDDGIVIGGDQFLPGISANIGVYPTEPEADPLTDWLDSCAGFRPHARDGALILPGHKLPFTGLPFRLEQMIENHVSALERLLDHLAVPRVAIDCFPMLFKRPIGPAEEGLALVEAVAHLNCLLRRRQVSRSLSEAGAYLWERVGG